MINLLLDDLSRPAGKNLDTLLKDYVLLVYLNGLPPLD